MITNLAKKQKSIYLFGEKSLKTKSTIKYMEYSSSDSLGKSQIQGVLASSLIGEKYTLDKNRTGTNVVFQPSGSFFSTLAIVDTSDNTDTHSETNDDDEDDDDEDDDKNGRFNFINDPINSFFIGSITVVGLFVLFRLLQKTK